MGVFKFLIYVLHAWWAASEVKFVCWSWSMAPPTSILGPNVSWWSGPLVLQKNNLHLASTDAYFTGDRQGYWRARQWFFKAPTSPRLLEISTDTYFTKVYEFWYPTQFSLIPVVWKRIYRCSLRRIESKLHELPNSDFFGVWLTNLNRAETECHTTPKYMQTL